MIGELIIIGGGSGKPEYMLPIAKAEIENADFLIAGKRFLEFINHPNPYKFGNILDTLSLLHKLLAKGSVAVVVSGDPLMYSFCKTIKDNMPEIKMKIIPAVGSLQLLGAKFGETMEHIKTISVHGREIKAGSIAMAVYENKRVFLLCSKEHNPAYISGILIKYGLEAVTLCIGANLSYEDEVLDTGKPIEIIDREYPELCTLLIKNPNAKVCSKKALLSDSNFLRNTTPMTKEEVRAIIILKMSLKPDDIIWDLGAGTGSISIETARQCPFGEIYSVEKNETAIDILKKNKEKFECENMKIKKGSAIEVIKSLPIPNVVFIGGSGGELQEIILFLRELNSNIRVVISAVTLETQNEAYQYMKNLSNFEIISVTIGRGKQIGSYTAMDMNNPVSIVSADIM